MQQVHSLTSTMPSTPEYKRALVLDQFHTSCAQLLAVQANGLKILTKRAFQICFESCGRSTGTGATPLNTHFWWRIGKFCGLFVKQLAQSIVNRFEQNQN